MNLLLAPVANNTMSLSMKALVLVLTGIAALFVFVKKLIAGASYSKYSSARAAFSNSAISIFVLSFILPISAPLFLALVVANVIIDLYASK